jgi:hypothetical protein
MLENVPDSELAVMIRATVAHLNTLGVEAHKRELIVRYDVKPLNNGNPVLRCQILTEVA